MSGQWRRLLGPRRWTLAGRMLMMQIGIVLIVLVGVAAVSIAQSQARLRDTEGRRALAVAEGLADNSGVRRAVEVGDDSYTSLAAYVVQTGKQFSGSTVVSVALLSGEVIASSDPVAGGQRATIQRTQAFEGRSWVGNEAGTGSAMAMSPIINESTRRTEGVVAVVRDYPSVIDDLGAAIPSLLTYLGIGGVLGVAGSLLIARRVKAQTLGLEPKEIAALVEQREAIVHGLKEGVLAIDLSETITMINDEAARLLGIPITSISSPIGEVDTSGLLREVFDTADPAPDQVIPMNGRLVTLNRRPVRSKGRVIGQVVTLRDRTQLYELQRELAATTRMTDSLRAQAHEFSNKMHVVNGLIDLGEYDEVRSFIRQLTAEREQWYGEVNTMVLDPAVAALVVAKASQATERGVTFLIDERTAVERLDPQLSTDVITVLGNLIDNAIDACVDAGDPVVKLRAWSTPEEVVISVRDTGPGVDIGVGERVFGIGFSTKDGRPAGRGVGLALARLICRNRGGDVEVSNDPGAVFTARLPLTALVATS